MLQLDAAPRFGGGWASLNLEELVAWLTESAEEEGGGGGATSTDDDDGGAARPRLIRLPPPRGAALPGASLILAPGVSLASLGPARGYSLDLAPTPLYAGGPAVAALLAAGAAPYAEFRLAGPGWVWDGAAGGLVPVPASRADVFRDGRLALPEKRGVMRFLAAAAAALGAGGGPGGGPLADALHSEGTPLAAIVTRAGLPRVVADAVLYGLAAADADQGGWERGEGAMEGGAGGRGIPPPSPPPSAVVPAPPAWGAAPLSGKDGGRTLSLYLASLGRYGSPAAAGGSGALLAAVHGTGELPQAFARASAVAGGAAALRRTAVAVEVAEEEGGGGRLAATGVRLSTGQRLTCRALAAGEEVVAGAGRGSPAPLLEAGGAPGGHPPSVSRAIAILDGPLAPLGCGDGAGAAAAPPTPSPDGVTAVLVLPPRCLSAAGGGGSSSSSSGRPYPPHAVRGLQAGHPTAACPAGRVVLYLSTPATSPAGPQADLEPALAALARLPGGKGKGKEGGEGTSKPRQPPAVLFAAFYREPGPAPPGAGDGLPSNVALLPPPTGALTAAAAAVAGAGAALEALWPGGEVRLFPSGAAAQGPAGAAGEGAEAGAAVDAAPPSGDDSDEEAAAALAAALAALDA